MADGGGLKGVRPARNQGCRTWHALVPLIVVLIGCSEESPVRTRSAAHCSDGLECTADSVRADGVCVHTIVSDCDIRPCRDPSDCDESKPFCLGGMCSKCSPATIQDGDRLGLGCGEGERCLGRECVPFPYCKSDKDCAGIGGTCYDHSGTTVGRCAPCSKLSLECPVGFDCNFTWTYCAQAVPFCQADSDCTEGMICSRSDYWFDNRRCIARVCSGNACFGSNFIECIDGERWSHIPQACQPDIQCEVGTCDALPPDVDSYGDGQ